MTPDSIAMRDMEYSVLYKVLNPTAHAGDVVLRVSEAIVVNLSILRKDKLWTTAKTCTLRVVPLAVGDSVTLTQESL